MGAFGLRFFPQLLRHPTPSDHLDDVGNRPPAGRRLGGPDVCCRDRRRKTGRVPFQGVGAGVGPTMHINQRVAGATSTAVGIILLLLFELFVMWEQMASIAR